MTGDRVLRATDRLLVGYALTVAVLTAAAGTDAPRWRFVALHLGIAAAALFVAQLDQGEKRPGRRWLHRWLPVIALPWLYDAAGRLRHLVVAHDLDPWVERWNEALFPGRWYELGARIPVAVSELFHGIYFSYYLLLFVPGLVAERRRPSAVDRYVFALTLTLLGHYALDFVFPVSGPAPGAQAGRGTLFVPLMRSVYFAFDRGGLAFPSTHVAAALVAAWFAARRFFERGAPAYALWVAALSISTVVCGYHYPIDVVAGLASGALCLVIAVRFAPPGPAA